MQTLFQKLISLMDSIDELFDDWMALWLPEDL